MSITFSRGYQLIELMIYNWLKRLKLRPQPCAPLYMGGAWAEIHLLQYRKPLVVIFNSSLAVLKIVSFCYNLLTLRTWKEYMGRVSSWASQFAYTFVNFSVPVIVSRKTLVLPAHTALATVLLHSRIRTGTVDRGKSMI